MIKRRGSRRLARPYAPRLIIMVKEPKAGRVKTRLARSIGVVAATHAYRSMMQEVTARLTDNVRWQTTLAVAPDGARMSPMLPARVRCVGQGGGDLGQRMQRLAQRAPPGPVIIIGTDIPGVRPDAVAGAFKALGSHDAVFGPAGDGGYWMVGFNKRQLARRAFANVRWSGPHALSDTAANLKAARIAYLAPLDDVDDDNDFRRLSALVGRRVLPRG